MERLRIEDLEIGADVDFEGDILLSTEQDVAYINKAAAIKIIEHLDEVFELGMVNKG